MYQLKIPEKFESNEEEEKFRENELRIKIKYLFDNKMGSYYLFKEL